MYGTYAIHTVRRSGSHILAQWVGAMFPHGAFYANENSPSANTYITPEGTFTAHKSAPSDVDLPLIYGRQDIISHESRMKCPNPSSHHILLLRDPINLFASKTTYQDHRARIQQDRDPFLACWISHAMEYLGWTSYMPRKTTVNYNRWCDSREYREEVAHAIGLEYNEAGLDNVPGDGGGSTWDGRNKTGSELRAVHHERFKQCLDNDLYRSVINQHPVVWDICKIIWPEIEAEARRAGLKVDS